MKGEMLDETHTTSRKSLRLPLHDGCGEGSDKHDRAAKEESAEEVEQVVEAEEKKEDHVGTRSNPLPIGQTIEDELAE